MPPLDSSTHVRCQSTRLHCFASCTGYSESSSGCTFWYSTVCTAENRRIRACCLSPSALCQLRDVAAVVPSTTAVPSTRPSTLGDRAFPVAVARASSSLPAETIKGCIVIDMSAEDQVSSFPSVVLGDGNLALSRLIDS